MNKLVFTILIILTAGISLKAQNNNDIQIAYEYYNKGEFEKAISYFEDILKDDNRVALVYDKYISALEKTNQEDKLRAFLKKMVRKNPKNLQYRIDEIYVNRTFGNLSQFNSDIKSYIEESAKEIDNIRNIALILMRKGEYDRAAELYLKVRSIQKSDYLFTQELLTIYRNMGDSKGVIKESLNLLELSPQNINYVQSVMQDFVTDKNSEQIETELLIKVQKDASGIYNDMLIWLYVQMKDFESAFIQAKALDRRLNFQGSELMDLALICTKNNAYETAINIYAYIIEKYPNGSFYDEARRRIIEAREEIVKNTFPVNEDQIKKLIVEYNKLVSDLGPRRTTAEAMRKMALLYAFYLNEKDSAIAILTEAIKIPRTNPEFIGLCKMDLGDIYLLKGESWESVLLYAQVDKSYKEDFIGQQAKLKLAYLYFFDGEFQLAQENLDILKMATTREIANDAMDLSILIQDNLALDTSDDALRAYAHIDLLLFRKQYDLVLNAYEDMLNTFPNHSLEDEVFWNISNIYLKKGEYEKCLVYLDKITRLHGEDILGDDALYLTATILEDYLDRNEEAMEIYKTFMLDFPGSIFVADARKRFRKLRGDFQ